MLLWRHSFTPGTLFGIILVLAPTAWLIVHRSVEVMDPPV
jgi:hypothetical protein